MGRESPFSAMAGNFELRAGSSPSCAALRLRLSAPVPPLRDEVNEAGIVSFEFGFVSVPASAFELLLSLLLDRVVIFADGGGTWMSSGRMALLRPSRGSLEAIVRIRREGGGR